MAGRKVNIRRYLPIMGLSLVLIAAGSYVCMNDNAGEENEVMQSEIADYKLLSGSIRKGQEKAVSLNAPAKLNAKQTEEGMCLSWEEVPEAIGYEVEINGHIVAEVFDNAYLQEDILENMSYTYRVRSKCYEVAGQWSEPLQVVFDENKEIESQETSAIYYYAMTYGNQVILKWQDEEAEYALKVDGKAVTDFSFEDNVYTYIHKNVAPGSTHTYVIAKPGESAETVKVTNKLVDMKTESHTLRLDGKTEDWSAAALVYEAGNKRLYSAQSEMQIALAASGVSSEGACFFLDIDLDGTTGYTAAGFAFGGADVLIDGETVYTYAGNGKNWKWQEAGKAQYKADGQSIETVFDKSVIGMKGSRAYGLGYNNAQENLMPAADETMETAYTQFVPAKDWTSNKPSGRAGNTHIVVDFDEVMFATGYEVRLNDAVLCKATSNTYRINHLQPGSTCRISVRPVMGNTKGSFSKVMTINMPALKEVKGYIQIDGDLSDWADIPVSKSKNGILLKTAQDEENLYACIDGEGEEIQIFIDSDQNKATGYRMEAFMENGADYMIDGSSVYGYSGNGEEWSWYYLGEAESSRLLLEDETVQGPDFVEMIISKKMLNIKDDFEMGVEVREEIYLSTDDKSMFTPSIKLAFDETRLKPPAVQRILPTLQTVAFTLQGNADSYLAEFDGSIYKASPDEDGNIRLAIGNLTPGKTYSYRLCSIKGNRQGAWSPMQVVTTRSYNLAAGQIVIDTNKSDWLGITPLMTGKNNNGILYFALDDANLYFLIQEQIGFRTETIFIDKDPLAGTGYVGSEWTDAGFDYMIEQGVLYRYAGDGESWTWNKLHSVADFFRIDGTIEGKLPLNQIGLDGKGEIWIGLEGTNQEILPKAEENLFVVSEIISDK